MSDPFEMPPLELPPADTPTTPPAAAIPGAPVDNIHFAHYDLTTGEIIATGHCAEPSLPANEALYPALGFVLGKATVELNRVDISATPHVIAARLVMPLTLDKSTITANGIDAATITGIPAGTVVTLLRTGDFPASSETVTGGSTTLSTVYPGPHTLRFELFPYVTTERVIDAV